VLLPVVPTSEVFEPQIQGIAEVNEPFLTQNVLLLFMYISGIAYLIFRILRQTLPVFHIIRKSEVHQYSSAKLIRTAEYPASFSFFSFVFVNPSIDEIETNEIVNHELEHIRQQHWIDLLLFEILRTMQWFNPAVWLYGHLIRQNHEYLADERALQRSSNPAIYRAALLNQMFGGPVISLANSFNYSLNKKRFTMMKQTISSPIRKLRLLLVLPFIAGIFYAFALPEYKFIQSEELAANATQNEKTIKGKVSDEKGKPLKSASIVILGKTIGTITDSNGNFMLKVNDDSPIMISYVGFETLKMKPDFGKEMSISMKTKAFQINLDKTDSEASKKKPIDLNNSNALIIVDGKEISKYELSRINPDKIESIDVLKDKFSVEKYGEKGKEGVVLLTLKSDKQVSNTYILKADDPLKFVTVDDSGKEPLYMKDGIIAESKDIQNLDPATIESISVLKGESATAVYGEKGKNGVVLITMKKGLTATKKEPIDIKVTGYASDLKANQPNPGIQIRSSGTSKIEPKPLVVIDGVIAENQNLDNILPDDIESMSVLKDESATSKYGDKGKNGVLEITLKPKTGVFTIVEEMPEFPGGVDALQTFVYSSMKYPEIALENGIQGQVYVKFVIEKTGMVYNAKISRGVDPSLDKEAKRIVESMPKWNPGKQNGEAVDVAFTMQINFKLPPEKVSKEKLK
jgi:TonB family protein